MPLLSLIPYFAGGLTLWVLFVSRLDAWIRGRDRDAPWQLLALLIGCALAFVLHTP